MPSDIADYALIGDCQLGRAGRTRWLDRLAVLAPVRFGGVLCRASRHAGERTLAHCAARGNNAGYRGRTGLYELIVADEALRRLIHDGAGEHELLRHARTRSASILDDGWAKVCAGITSVDEVLRVTRDE